MKATWFENRELITLYTDPAYFGADVPDSYQHRPSKPVPVKSLFGYEPSSKMDDIHHKDEVLQIALKMKAGTWKGLPIVCRKDPKGYQVLDGHHRMHAARKAGLDTLDAVIVDREDIEYSDEVKEQVNEASGYIPTAAQANDPRFKTALTVDVRPGEDQRNIEKLGLNLNMDLVNKTKPGRKYKKRTLKEAPQDWGDMKLDGDKTQQSIDYFYTDHAPNKIGNRRDAGNFKGFNVVTFTKGADTLMFLVDNKDRAVFYVAFTDMEDGVAIGNVRSNGTVRATEVYAFLVNKFKTLYSDKHQTPQGRKIWSDFAKFFPNIKVTDTGERLKATTLEESLMERYQAIKEEDLLEVDMSPGALRSWAKSEMAQGVNAGFELELVLADTESSDDDDYEADLDADEPIGTLDEIVDFYDGPSGMGAWTSDQRQTEEQFREAVIEDLIEYTDEQFFQHWMQEGEEMVRDEMEAELERNVTDEEFMEEFENEGEIFERVREDEQDKYRDDITWAEFWESQQIETMGDLMNKYDLYFPYTAGSEGGDKSLDEWAEEISAVTGKGTNISYQYHGSDKESGKYTLEPDSSITADESEDAGIELVSPVMPLEEAIDQLEKLFNYIEEKDGDIYTNSSTGFHMNISVPQGNDIDYTKLVLFSGDKFILDKYNRLSNSYANSALGQLEARAAQLPPEKAAEAMQKMKDNLEDTAEEYVRAGTGQAKYTSIHIKDGYIEFRGPGGVYTNKSFGENMNTMLRFARAMTIAADPQAYRQEYQKKLYKTLSKSESSARTIDSLFADFQSGDINKEVFKKRWANLVVQQKQNQAILNKLDDKPDDKRLAKAKQLQKDLGGPVKPWKYTMQYTTADGTEKTMERKVNASSAQIATQAAIQDALNVFEHPQKKTDTPDFNTLKVEIDLPSPAQPQVADLEDKEVAYMVSIPYEVGGDTGEHSVIISARNPQEAKQEGIRRVRRGGFPSSWNWNYAGTTAEER